MNRNAPIGVFDSGIGGLTVVRELRKLLPREDVLYAGDTARVPYGSRDPKEIVEFLVEFLRFFAEKQVKMAVIACNTMTAHGYEKMKSDCDFLLVPMNSGVADAIACSPTKRIGVIATEGTVDRAMHAKAAATMDGGAQVFAKACPAFVPLIESGQIKGEAIERAAEEYLAELRQAQIDALILGCTHYPLADRIIQNAVGDRVRLVNPARATARDAADALKKAGLLRDAARADGSLGIYFSADLVRAKAMTQLILHTDQAAFAEMDLTRY